MVIKFLQDKRLSIVWTLLRVWVGWQWLEAGLHKFSDPNWFVTGVALKGFWVKAVTVVPGTNASPIKYGFFHSFINSMLNGGQYTWFAKFITLGEILVGIGFILGAASIVAFAAGAFMNLNYMLAGSTSSNPVLYTVAILLLIAGPAAYYYGVDYYVLKYFRRRRGNGAIGESVFAAR